MAGIRAGAGGGGKRQRRWRPPTVKAGQLEDRIGSV